MSDLYNSFTLKSTPLTLTAVDGSGANCYPFSGYIVADYPEAQYPACTVTPPQEGEVCAYKYLTDGTGEGPYCSGREYEMITYASAGFAVVAGAYVTHYGACGVCSNAHDLAARMQSGDKANAKLQTESTICATQYIFAGGDFDKLVNCIMDRIGYTPECSRLYAHQMGNIADICGEFCQPKVGENQELFGLETCATSECFDCSFSDTMMKPMFELGGRGAMNSSGIVENIILPCDSFYRLQQNPCAGTTYSDSIPLEFDPAAAGSSNGESGSNSGGVGGESSTNSQGNSNSSAFTDTISQLSLYVVTLVVCAVLLFK